MDAKVPEKDSVGTFVGHVPMDRLRRVFDGMFDGVWLVGADGGTTYVNGAMAELLGTTPTEMRDRSIHDFLDEAFWPEIDAFLDRQRSVTDERIEVRLRRSDGTDLFGRLAGSPITTLDGDFAGTMLDFSDVAGKLKFDAQRAQNQRLEAIGEFAGAIAHDFNNLLTSIRGHAELARNDMSEDDPTRLDLDQVILSADRATGITRKLLAFTRQQILAPVVLDPAQVIADLAPMLQPMLGDDIGLVLRVDPSGARVRVDPVQLEQVIVNLAVNARDAMPTGGTLSVSVQNLQATDSARLDSTSTDGQFVRITVADTGTGMDEQTMTRIFDPFFTTKSVGQGTGLGLATVFGIVAQSDGRIQVESAPGKGATFSIDLPRANAAAEPRRELPPARPAVRGSGIVLLAEDEPAVRDFVRRALEAAGYTVLSASNADEALGASRRWGEQIDVLLTDIVMPGIHGPELAFLIREQRPGIGILYMSGNADDAVARGGEFATPGAFLPKPFTADALTKAVARASAAVRVEQTSEVSVDRG